MAAKEPFLDRQMIRFAHDAVLKSGVFRETLRAWRRKLTGQKTWINFQTFMATQYDDYLEDQAAEDHHPFAGAAIQADTLAALQNVVEEMKSNRADIAILSEFNATFEKTNTTLEGQMKTALN